MAELCLSLGCPEVVRFSLMDRCSGVPTPGATNGYALACPRNFTLEPIIREGEASEFVSDCGYVQVRDQQDDQHLGWTASFETAVRSNELEALLTGKTLISSGGNNIGTYGVGGEGCEAPASDPSLILEAFYKLSKCATGADHVRYVIPGIRFKVTEVDKEGTITYFRYTGVSEPTLVSGLVDTGVPGYSGPFDDFPADVVTFLDGRPAGERTTGFDFEESITISGSCGAIAVPAPA